LLSRGQKGWFAIAGTGSVEPALVAFDFAKVIIAASRLFGQEVCALRKSAFARLSGHGITHLDFASKVVCHETPAWFLWILPAAPPQGLGKALPNKYDWNVRRNFNF